MERAVFISELDRLPPPAGAYDRLYLGSEFCVWRLPGERELHAALLAATQAGMGFSLVTPFLDEPGLTRMLALIRALPNDPALEVVANDLGLIEALRASGWRGTIVAGRLLTRQRRGPGFQSFGDVPAAAAAALRGSALDAPGFVELLGSTYGVERFELDDLVQGVCVPALPAGVRLSLYRPYLLVTATRNCPWLFDGKTWDRSRSCPRPCRGPVLGLVPVQGCRAGINPAPTTDIARAGINPAPTTGIARAGIDPAPTTGIAQAGINPAPTTGIAQAGINPAPTTDIPSVGEGFTPSRSTDRPFSPAIPGGPQRQDPAIQQDNDPFSEGAARSLLLGGCAQFLEHRNDGPPPAGVDRIVWQPQIPA